MASMASLGCWKCLQRPSTIIPRPLIIHTTAQFSNTTPFQATPAKKKPKGVKDAVKLRVRNAPKIKKKNTPKSTGRPPMPGERKALRKRVVLSNTNALEVTGMVDLSVENADDANLVGKVMGIPGPVVDQLRAVDAFKITQAWNLFRRPGVLVREEGVKIAQMFDEAVVKKEALRLLIDGQRSTGKSLLTLHALTTAFLKGWIVINIPEAQDMVSATTDFAPIPNTNPTKYSQHSLAAHLLSQIGKANNAVLSQLTLSMEHPDSPVPIQSNISLARLAELGARDPDIASSFFEIFWREITAEGRPPICMALDGVNHIMQDSAYRTADFKPIHSHDFVLVKHFVDALSGASKLPNGGAVITATSRAHAPRSPAIDLLIAQHADREAGEPLTMKEPYMKYDERTLEVLGNADVKVIELQGLSKSEARGLMEYWAASGLLRTKVDEAIVAEKWALAGNGIIGEIERGVLHMRI